MNITQSENDRRGEKDLEEAEGFVFDLELEKLLGLCLLVRPRKARNRL